MPYTFNTKKKKRKAGPLDMLEMVEANSKWVLGLGGGMNRHPKFLTKQKKIILPPSVTTPMLWGNCRNVPRVQSLGAEPYQK